MNSVLSRCCLLGLLLLTAVLYYPALDSPFWLDDFQNLGGLSDIKTQGYLPYIFSGVSGPSGRPLSLLSFALQHSHWPDNPFPFKLVNLLLHLLNGILVFCVCRLLTTRLSLSEKASMALPLLATVLWLLHPLQLSTTLYVVQRMTQLSTLFMLIGLLAYLGARIHYQERKIGLLLMAIAVTLGTSLAILSKENGVLLPLYILVLEYTLLADLSRSKAWKAWAGMFLILPLLSLLAYLVYTLPTALGNYHEIRDFTAGQRLITQAIILFDYLRIIILPYPDAFSLFHDDYPFSVTLLTPPITLLAIIGWAMLISLAIISRKGRYKVLAFAILWFVAGHSLEASHLNLELYFEHRNYLPSMGIFFLLAWLSVIAWQYLSNKLYSSLLIAGFYVLVITITVQQITLWANPLQQTIEWYHLHPRSVRIIDNMANIYSLIDKHTQAIETYYRINEIYPQDIYPQLRELSIRTCTLEAPIANYLWNDILNKASTASYNGVAPIIELDELATRMQDKDCSIDAYKLAQLTVTLALNENFKPYSYFLHQVATNLALHLRDPRAALENLNAAIAYQPKPEFYALKIRILLGWEKLDAAKVTINEFSKFLQKHPGYWLVNRKIIDELEARWLALQNDQATDEQH